MRLALALASLLVLAGCGDDVVVPPADLASTDDFASPRDLSVGVCSCLAQLCAVPCSMNGQMPPVSLECSRCLHNGQQPPDMGNCVFPAAGQCGACYGVPGCDVPAI